MKVKNTTELIVDTKTIRENVKLIQTFIGDDVKIMAVLKAAGYGPNLNYNSEITNLFDYIAVATVKEGIELRENDFQGSILILNPSQDLETYVKYNLICNACSLEDIKKISQIDDKIKVHIEIDTGMGRTGIKLFEIEEFILELKKIKNIEVGGIFSHFSSGGQNEQFSRKQLADFSLAIKKFNQAGIEPKNLHICNSGGLLLLERGFFNMVRLGLLLYGYYPNKEISSRLKLKPALILKTKINFIKIIYKGETVGYNQSYVAQKRTKVAMIPVGFADCIIGLEANGFVIVNNKKVQILATCMDNMIIDVTTLKNVNINDEVYFWDNKLIRLDQIKHYCSYEIMVSLSNRIERKCK